MDLQLSLFAPVFLSLVLAASVTDWLTGRLPDWNNVALFVSGIGFALSPYGSGLLDGVSTAVLGGGALWLIAVGYRLERSREGLGGGDIKFVAACGPWVGLYGLAPMIFISATSALLFASVLAFSGRQVSGSTEIRFGPFLAFAAVVVWAAGVFGVAPFILDNYLPRM